MSGYHSEGAYGPFTRRQHHGRHLVEIVTIAGLVGILAAAVLIAAVKFKPPVYTVCQPAGPALACVTSPQPPAMPIPARFEKPGI